MIRSNKTASRSLKSQQVDFWALSASNPTTYLSMSHTHAILRKLVPKPSDTLFSNTSKPMLSFTADTTKGDHDTLISACNPARYEKLGAKGWHASCEENYRIAVDKAGYAKDAPKAAPTPMNLFMNVKVAEGKIVFEKPSSVPGASVCFMALEDLIIVMSACPMDFRASADWLPIPADVQYEIVGENVDV